MNTSTAAADFTNIANWQGVDDKPTAGSRNLIESGGVDNRLRELNVIFDIKEQPVIDGNNLIVGSLYNGNPATSVKDCLTSEIAYKIIGGTILKLEHAQDISLRVTEYNKDGVFVKQTGYSSISSVATDVNTRFVKISASYASRGYSSDNPISVSDFVDGDFQMYIPMASSGVDKKPIKGSTNFVESDGIYINTIEKIGISFITSSYNGKKVLPNIDTANFILDLGRNPILLIGNKVYDFSVLFPNNPEYYRQISIKYEDNNYSTKLVLNTSTNRLYVKLLSAELTEDEMIIGGFRIISNVYISAELPFNYQENGLSLDDKVGVSFIPTKDFLPNIDTANKILDLGSDPVLIVGNKIYGFGSIFSSHPEYYRAIPIYVDGQASGAVCLIFNINTKRLYPQLTSYTLSNSEIIIGGFRLTYNTHNFVSATLPFNFRIDEKELSTQEQKEVGDIVDEKLYSNKVLYQGKKPNISNIFTWKKLFQLSELGSYSMSVDSQGMDIYQDTYLFQGNSPSNSANNNIYIINLLTKQIIGGFLYRSDSHLNTINCGEKYSEDDTYPLLYVSQSRNDHGCDVIRISNDLSQYTSMQFITYNGTEYMQNYDYDWNIGDNYIYCFGTKNGNTQILKFRKPQVSEGNVVFGDSDILDVIEFTGAYIYQGNKIIDGQLYMAFGYGSTQYPSYIKVLDLETKALISHIPLDGLGETEAIAKYGNSLVIVNNNWNPTYRQLFF